jgi:putative transposase
VKGRKRHILVDTLGLVLKVNVHAANIQDRNGARALLKEAKEKLPRVAIVWADHAYKGGWGPKRQLHKLDEWVWQELGWLLEVVERATDEAGNTLPGFHPLPKRWVVERTFAWLGRYRRLSKDYEYLPSTQEAFIYLASAHTLLRRLCKPKPFSFPPLLT